MEAYQKVYQYLDSHNMQYQVVDHEPAFHVSDMVDIKEPENSVGVKNLFLQDEKKQNFFLVVVPQEKRVNIKELRRQIGSKPLSFAGPDLLWQYLQVAPGSVSPFGILNDPQALVNVILDEALLAYDKIGPHPNDNTKTVWIGPKHIQAMIEENGNPLHIILVAEKI